MFKVGQKVYHKFFHQECEVVTVRIEPEFHWSDGKVDAAFDWVDVRLPDGHVVGGNADAFRALEGAARKTSFFIVKIVFRGLLGSGGYYVQGRTLQYDGAIQRTYVPLSEVVWC